MSQPVLTIVAGCNGSGKSTFSHALVKEGVIPFDYDKRYKEIYQSIMDSEFREVVAKNMATKEFESSLTGAFLQGTNCCYETNFDAHPIYWAAKAKDHGYFVERHFFCLDTLDLAKQRVEARVRNKGHFISDEVIYHKWKEGYKNLNLHHEFFDHIVLVDNSFDKGIPQHLFKITRQGAETEVQRFVDNMPKYCRRRFPDICRMIEST